MKRRESGLSRGSASQVGCESLKSKAQIKPLKRLTGPLARLCEFSLQNLRFSLGSLLFSLSSVEVIINTYNIYMGAPLRRLLRVIRAPALNGFSSVPGSLE